VNFINKENLMILCLRACLSVVLSSLSACALNGVNGAAYENSPASVFKSGESTGLGIVGLNYTDLVIEYFSVNGQGGGNIAVSSPTGGGGGTVCCIVWHPGTVLPVPVKIEWMRRVGKQRRWCRKTVMLDGPVPDQPTDFAVHFMPSGDINVEITRYYPDLKLKLDNYDYGHRRKEGNVVYDEQAALCRYGDY
jgi:hypothetical protein